MRRHAALATKHIYTAPKWMHTYQSLGMCSKLAVTLRRRLQAAFTHRLATR